MKRTREEEGPEAGHRTNGDADESAGMSNTEPAGSHERAQPASTAGRVEPDAEDDQPLHKNFRMSSSVRVGAECPYLDTISRQVRGRGCGLWLPPRCAAWSKGRQGRCLGHCCPPPCSPTMRAPDSEGPAVCI